MRNLVVLVVLFVFFSVLVGKFPRSGFRAEKKREGLEARSFKETERVPGNTRPGPTDFDKLRHASAARSAETSSLAMGPASPTWKSLYYLRDGPETLRVAGTQAPPAGELALG